MPDEIDSLITRLDTWLRENRPNYYASLRPGLNEDKVAAIEAALSIDLPNAFRRFLMWRNGQIDQSESLVDIDMLMDARDMINSREMLNGLLERGVFTDRHDDWWRAGWVPFLYDGFANHLCLDLDPSAGVDRGRIVRFWHDAPERPVEHESFAAWLHALVQGFESGVAEWGESGDEDDEDN